MTDVAEVAERVRAAAHWRLSVGEPLAGGSRSAVYAAHDERGRELVVKLPEARCDRADLTSVETAA